MASEGGHTELKLRPALNRSDFNRERGTVVSSWLCKPLFSSPAEFQDGYVICTVCAMRDGTDQNHDGDWMPLFL